MSGAGGAFQVVVCCDNCGKPGTVTPDWAQLEMTQFSGPDVTARAALCPVCSVTVEAMLFTRWNGRNHSHRFLPGPRPGLELVVDDDEDELDDENATSAVESPPAMLETEGDDDGDGWREPTEEELWTLWRADQDSDPDEP